MSATIHRWIRFTQLLSHRIDCMRAIEGLSWGKAARTRRDPLRWHLLQLQRCRRPGWWTRARSPPTSQPRARREQWARPRHRWWCLERPRSTWSASPRARGAAASASPRPCSHWSLPWIQLTIYQLFYLISSKRETPTLVQSWHMQRCVEWWSLYKGKEYKTLYFSKHASYNKAVRISLKQICNFLIRLWFNALSIMSCYNYK